MSKTIAQEVIEQRAGHRIVFLDDLRAIAVLLVVWAHIFIVGIGNPDFARIWLPAVPIQNVFGPTATATNPHALTDAYFMLTFGVSSGPLGVALFFLISGFVILRSVDTLPPLRFLTQRFFRIFPLSFAVTLGVALFTAAYCAVTGTISPHSIFSVVTSALALNDFFGTFATMPVLWSLTVELLFYVLISIAVAALGRLGFRSLTGLSFGFTLAVGLINQPAFAQTVPRSLLPNMLYASSMLVHVIFMLVGSALYRGWSDRREAAAVLYGAAILGLYFAAYTWLQALRGPINIGVSPGSAITALGLFLAAYWINHWLTGRVPAARILGTPLRFVAKISYPLYLVHLPLGWAVLLWLGAAGWGMNEAAIAATVAMMVVAWVFHISVEMPTHRLGKWLTRRGRPPAQAPMGVAAHDAVPIKEDLLSLLHESMPNRRTKVM